jgi:predicted RNA-binding protein associated with RNAse of E/G family
MSHEDLLLATLYTKNGPVSVEQEIIKDVDRLMAARCSNQLTDKELAQANIDTVRRLMAHGYQRSSVARNRPTPDRLRAVLGRKSI